MIVIQPACQVPLLPPLSGHLLRCYHTKQDRGKLPQQGLLTLLFFDLKFVKSFRKSVTLAYVPYLRYLRIGDDMGTYFELLILPSFEPLERDSRRP